MNNRIIKKVIRNPDHPRHKNLVTQMERTVRDFAQGECRRRGLNPEHWGSYTINWTPRMKRIIWRLKTRA